MGGEEKRGERMRLLSASSLPGESGTEASAACCFTGHRSLPPDKLGEIREKTAHVVDVLVGAGYRWFFAGGALGFDTMAAGIVIEKRKSVPDVRLILTLPCRDQTARWLRLPVDRRVESLTEYQRLKGLADEVRYVRDFYSAGCMRERNQYMIDHSSFCVALYDGAYSSGAGQTVRMAKRAGLRVYNVWDAILKKENRE